MWKDVCEREVGEDGELVEGGQSGLVIATNKR